MYSELKSVDPGRAITSCLFIAVASGAQTLSNGTNVTAHRHGEGVYHIIFSGINIYNAEVPIIVPTLYLKAAAALYPQIGAVTQSASAGTVTITMTVYKSDGAVEDLTATDDLFGLVMDYRRAVV